ncbi:MULTISPECIES: hypothetical protein [Proteiniphilum]|jgi:hypothetical protein|uniref:hypothetical protein n=1 Tax=Proteiniphilum TaxID=294702 RepID=UPI001EEA1287|nr:MULTISPECIES: hypothetical protein [Proteiniphilum]ULB35579.1 hypothetical protein KDN43_05970 [Proteiniphilum propionicum]
MKSNRRSFLKHVISGAVGSSFIYNTYADESFKWKTNIENDKQADFIHGSSLPSGGSFFNNSTPGRVNASGIIDIHSEIKINEPFHGAILNWRHGEKTDNGLKIRVKGTAPVNQKVIVNGVIAQRNDTMFTAEIIIEDKETEITATAGDYLGQKSHSIRVIWDRNSFPRYSLNIDDNIFFLRDIARKKYTSLFDCFYLKGLREIHRKYGTKYHLNIYYSDGLEYTQEKEFTLCEFPDRYKSEWIDNSDWLKLAFHAYTNKPDRPYQNTPPEKIINDLDMVAEQIFRFAGQETYGIMTNIHWDLNPSAFKPLANKGIRVLSAYFAHNQNGWNINLGLDEDRSRYLSTHDLLMDFDSGIIFCKTDMVCNSTPLNEIVPTLESISKNPDCAEIMDIFTHEQYFWPFYNSYLPDHFQRLEKTVQWLTEHNYKPVLWNDGIMGAPI